MGAMTMLDHLSKFLYQKIKVKKQQLLTAAVFWSHGVTVEGGDLGRFAPTAVKNTSVATVYLHKRGRDPLSATSGSALQSCPAIYIQSSVGHPSSRSSFHIGEDSNLPASVCSDGALGPELRRFQKRVEDGLRYARLSLNILIPKLTKFFITSFYHSSIPEGVMLLF